MSFWIGLIAGLIIGWVIEWIIDWRFWRGSLHSSLSEDSRLRKELENARQEIARLQAGQSGTSGSNDEPTAGEPEQVDKKDGVE